MIRHSDFSADRLSAALELARTGLWERDLHTNKTVRTPIVDEMFGFKPGEVGDDAAPFINRIHPEDLLEMQRSLAEAARLGTFVEMAFRIARIDGPERWIAGRAEFARDDQGKPARLISVLRDVTDQRRAEETLRKSEAEFRAIFEMAGRGKALTDTTGRFLMVNRAYCEITGYSAEELRARTFYDITHPDDRAQDALAIQQLTRGDLATHEREKRYVRKDGVVVWARTSAVLLRDKDERPSRLVAVTEDISARRRADLALTEETRRLDILNRTGALLAAELDLEKLVQAVTDSGVTLTGAAFGAFFYNVVNEKGQSYTLYTLSGVSRDAFASFPMPRNTAVFGPTFSGEGVVRSDDITKDARYGKNPPHKGMPEGHLPVRSYLAVPVISRSGEVLGGLFFGHPQTGVFTENAERLITGIAAQAAIAIDNARLFQAAQQEIAQRKSAEARLTTVAGEVDHRAKNMLGLVQAMVRLTKADTLVGYVAALTGRINALAHAHTLLSESRWDGADLLQIAEDELAPYRRDDLKITMSGPPVRLSSSAAQPIAVALHELATNALKYGALSAAHGRLSLTWKILSTNQLELIWTEAGGPTVREPRRKGFGTAAIDRMIKLQLGGELQMDWRPAGLSCTITFPLGSS
jgi:PAS domain S-box-containing protein